MNTEKFLEIKRIDKENGFSCGCVKSINEASILHSHDYYEILMITNGSACHIINSKKQILYEGALLSIRDFNVHDFKKDKNDIFEYIYISMSKKLFMSILEYLGEDFPIDILLEAEDPPMAVLSSGEKENVVNIVSKLDQINC